MTNHNTDPSRSRAEQMTVKFNRFAFGIYWAIRTKIHRLRLKSQEEVMQQALFATKSASPKQNLQVRDLV